MNIHQYQKEADNTKSTSFYAPVVTYITGQTTSANINVDVLHAIVGISTEGGELLDVAKKAMFYGKSPDYVNLDEEMGDVLWYIAIYANARGTTIEALAQQNNAKLRQRFPNKFSEHLANNRNLAAEREVLEQHSPGAHNGQAETQA